MEGSLPAIYTDLLVFSFLLFMSGFFASSEVVFFSISQPFMLKYSKKKVFRILMYLLSRPKEVLVSILLGNELVNVLISSYGAKLFTDALGKEGAILSALIMSTLIFIFGETLPKNAVMPVAERLSLLYAPVFYIFHILITPIRFFFLKPLEGILRRLGIETVEEKYELSEEKLLSILEIGVESGEFAPQEREMIEKVFEMDEVLVREIMTPRPDLFALPEKAKVGDVIEEIKMHGHSRIPLYAENPDEITGIVYVKEILPVSKNRERELGEFKKPAIFVPEVTTVSGLLKELRKKKSQMAIVVDEHGAVSGVITMYDVLRWLVGEVPEEWEEEQEDVVKLASDAYKVEGSADIEEVAREIGFDLPEDYDYDTVGGFVMANLEKVPEKGDEFEYGGFKFIVGEVDKNRVQEVIVMSIKNSHENARS